MFKRTRYVTRVIIVISIIVTVAVILINDSLKDESNSSSEQFESVMREARADNNLRLKTVRDVCAKHNLGIFKTNSEAASIIKYPPAVQYTVFYIDRSHNLSYCPIYKSGSTTWIYNLCLLMGLKNEEIDNSKDQLSTIARRVLPVLEYPEAEQALQLTKKLLVVRHPFERLLSAYRDKLENSVAGREHGTLHFYNKFGAKIVKKYRKPEVPLPTEDQAIKRRGVPEPAGIEPTWREFVMYLINTDIANYGDDHWMPYYLFCTPCSLEYDLMAKVESLQRDQEFALHELGLYNLIKPQWKHRVNSHVNAAKIYFSQLNKQLVNDLYKKYQLDFELFSYEPTEYFEYATSTF